MNDSDVPVRRLGTEVYFDNGMATIEGYVVDQYKLNDAGTVAYLACDGRRTIHEVIGRVAQAFGVPEASCADDVRGFLRQLTDADLIRT